MSCHVLASTHTTNTCSRSQHTQQLTVIPKTHFAAVKISAAGCFVRVLFTFVLTWLACSGVRRKAPVSWSPLPRPETRQNRGWSPTPTSGKRLVSPAWQIWNTELINLCTPSLLDVCSQNGDIPLPGPARALTNRGAWRKLDPSRVTEVRCLWLEVRDVSRWEFLKIVQGAAPSEGDSHLRLHAANLRHASCKCLSLMRRVGCFFIRFC